MNKTVIHRAVLLVGLATSSVTLPAFAFSDWAKDAAYYTNMQKDLHAKARANSTAAKEAQISQRARAADQCNDLKQASIEAAATKADRHIAPDPTKVIENSTCFIDVQQIPIPATGWGFADQMLQKFMGDQLRKCGNTIGNWGNMVNAVKTRDWKSLGSLSMQEYRGQRTNLSPVENTLLNAGGAYNSGQNMGTYAGQQAGNYVGGQVGSYVGQQAGSYVGQQAGQKVGGYVGGQAGGFVNGQVSGQLTPAPAAQPPVSGAVPQRSLAESLWSRLTGPGS